jgi:Phosphotransferase enzyme family
MMENSKTVSHAKTIVNYVANLTAEAACEALRGVGMTCSPEDAQIIARDERWAVLMPGERIAWFPGSESGHRRLTVERRVLHLLAERCSYRAPRILFVSALGFDARQMVSGRCDPWGLFHRCKADSPLVQRIGRSIGGILAEQHMNINETDVAGWLPQRVTWPQPRHWIRERLPHVVDDHGLIRVMEQVIERCEGVQVCRKDRVLVHGDVGFHNLALDPSDDTINGIFDYDGAAWADRHHDFRYLLFDLKREDMLDSALAVYEPATGRNIDRNRVRLYNAGCAIGFLAFRSGTSPDQRSCGRTLAEDIRWVRTALSKIT